MNIKTMVCLVAGVVAFAAPASSMTAAQRNVAQSARYERLLETNLKFRHARMRKECGPIHDAELRQSCLESFAKYEPVAVSPYHHYYSTRHYHHNCRCYHYHCCYHHSQYHTLG